jgi:dTMP kinase
MVIIIEGVPGSGKTTTIEHLLWRINKKFEDIEIEYLPEILPETKGSLDDLCFYIKNDINKSRQLSSKQNCLSDRYWHSTVVYECAKEQGMILENLMNKYKELYMENMFHEYFYIYLETDINKSMEKSAVHEVESGWKDRNFVLRTLELYRLLYDNLEIFSPGIKGKLILNVNEMGYERIERILEEMITNER